jgi:glycosyltransferase involved in cell wall biosynthesis
MKMKRGMITLIAHDPSRSGIWRYSLELFKALKRIDCANVIFVATPSTFMKAPSFEGFEPVYGVMIYSTTRLFALTLNHNANAYHILNATLSGYFKLKPLIVTVHDLMPFTLFKERASSWAHMGWLFTYGVQRSMRTGLINAERIICISESTKNDLLRFIDVDPKKVRVIYYGVDHELFKLRDKLEARRRLGLPLDRPIILNVGSEEPRKNIPILLKSFKKLLNDVPNALLVRVGERTAHMEKLIRNLDLSNRVLYRRASLDEVALYYNAADLLCFPSYYEGFGNPPLEAMASELPVIAGNRTSIPEVVGDGGILLDPFDVDGFAYWMREVLTNEDLRDRLSEAGYKRSMNFSWEKCARETLEVYREVLNEA